MVAICNRHETDIEQAMQVYNDSFQSFPPKPKKDLMDICNSLQKLVAGEEGRGKRKKVQNSICGSVDFRVCFI